MSKYKNLAIFIYAVIFVIHSIGGNFISAALMLVCMELMIIRWAIEDKK